MWKNQICILTTAYWNYSYCKFAVPLNGKMTCKQGKVIGKCLKLSLIILLCNNTITLTVDDSNNLKPSSHAICSDRAKY